MWAEEERECVRDGPVGQIWPAYRLSPLLEICDVLLNKQRKRDFEMMSENGFRIWLSLYFSGNVN